MVTKAGNSPFSIRQGPLEVSIGKGAGCALSLVASWFTSDVRMLAPCALRWYNTQCDGQMPCGRCSSRQDAECVYETPMRESKESLRKQLDSLQQQQRNRDTILSALCQPHLGHEVIRRLHGGQSAERILAWLDGISVGPPLYGTGNSQNLGFSDPTSHGDDGLDHCTVDEVVNTAAAPNAPGSARQTTPRSKTVDHNTKERGRSVVCHRSDTSTL
ncbi:hypothetical protein Purlil1_13513 [Purpureocillium lilacinum]|uniref:Zn(2)-C6 fungal-type domain-containing protein n=1 Tax=Purpureocillium lilacinum TaxID=33203 RepID=A0ABR0BDV0_PURLI|nr:hypothetical protein Purlil1_13513 [Purpureocillium lilacinum]